MTKFMDVARGQMTVDAQNRHIRKLPLNVARGWTNKTIPWTDIYAKSTRVVQMSDDEILAKAKTDPNYREALLAELAAMDE